MKDHKTLRQKLRNIPTPQEIILWARLRRKQLGHKFRRQHSIGPYIVDFYCSELQLVIELDGWQHKEEFSGEDEKVRTVFLEERGVYILRFWNNDVNDNLENVLQCIVDTCKVLCKNKI